MKMTIFKPVIGAVLAELWRQHDQSGPTGLSVGCTDDPDVLELHGPVDVSALAKVAFAAALDLAHSSVEDVARSMVEDGRATAE